jgi:hypothetical protein
VVVVVLMIVFAVTIMVTIAVVIPVMIVLEAATVAIPVPCVVSTAFVARDDPVRSGVRGTSPVSFVPVIMAIHGIPVTLYPEKLRAGAHGPDIDARRRRGPYGDPNFYLSVCSGSANGKRGAEQQQANKSLHRFLLFFSKRLLE